MTAAATAPSTNGASTRRTCPLGRPSSRCLTVRIELPRSARTTTPCPSSARAIASRTDSLFVPRVPPGPPPAGSTRTSAPATGEVRSASPRASSRLWDTSTIPTKSTLLPGPLPGSWRPFAAAAVVYTTDRNSAMPNSRAPKSSRRRSSIQSIDRATAILRALATGPRRLGVSELAERLGLARPTVHGLLQTLQTHGFVEQDRHSDKYQLGPGLLQLGYSYLDLNELRARSIQYSDRLAARASAAVRVGVMHGSSVVVVHHVFKPDAAFGVLEVGLQLPLHASALGKAILAFSPAQLVDDALAEQLAVLTKRTLGPAALRRELAVVRDQGIATERDEAVLGESSAAAPIFDDAGHAVGAIGVVAATEELFPRGLARGIAAAVGEAARG